jgi:hypothetical protein
LMAWVGRATGRIGPSLGSIGEEDGTLREAVHDSWESMIPERRLMGRTEPMLGGRPNCARQKDRAPWHDESRSE